jgi:hypothetical protein
MDRARRLMAEGRPAVDLSRDVQVADRIRSAAYDSLKRLLAG